MVICPVKQSIPRATAYQQLPVNVILREKSTRRGFCEYFYL
jgi:hypothetical protein